MHKCKHQSAREAERGQIVFMKMHTDVEHDEDYVQNLIFSVHFHRNSLFPFWIQSFPKTEYSEYISVVMKVELSGIVKTKFSVLDRATWWSEEDCAPKCKRSVMCLIGQGEHFFEMIYPNALLLSSIFSMLWLPMHCIPVLCKLLSRINLFNIICNNTFITLEIRPNIWFVF